MDDREETFVASVPQRYAVNFPRYLARNGLVRPEDKHGFEAFGYKGDLSRFYFMSLMFDQIIKEGVLGNFAELGVYKGNTASVLAKMARRSNVTLYLFDTFEGFSDLDLVEIDSNKRMEFQDTSLEAVKQHVGEESVRIVQGYFPDSTAQIPPNLQFAAVHIDCDLYLPFQAALEYFWPRLAPGGFLLMHDYNSLHWDGSEKAVDEFFADKPESVVPVPDASGTVVVRKSRTGGARSNWLLNRKAALATDRWAGSGFGELTELLEGAWGGLESWGGAWGLGRRHSVRLYLSDEPTGDVEVTADCAAALIGTRTEQVVDVEVEGRRLVRWTFTPSHNQMLRTVVVPREFFALTRGSWTVAMDFAPHSVVKTDALMTGVADDRELGLALYRLRQRVLEPNGSYLIACDEPALLAQYLDSGWSGIEPWGVWGTGPSHKLNFPDVGALPAGSRLDIKGSALLLGSQTRQEVEVRVGRTGIAKLTFDRVGTVESFSVPLPEGAGSSGALVIEFRPSSTASPCDLDSSIPDTRPMGLALYGVAIRRPLSG